MTPKAISVRPVIRGIIPRTWCSLRCGKAAANWSRPRLRWNVRAKQAKSRAGRKSTVEQAIRREIVAWFWVGLVFLLVNGAVGQARVIPSGSMQNTLLVGDHLIMSRV